MNEMVTLQNIERRIAFHIQGAYANILEVGRCLIEAKESRLVEHGQWADWVMQHTGMSDRSAQRIMQAAREVSPESAMNRLPISKIAAILALPEGQREEVAVKAVEENQSLRKLKLEIEGLRMDLKHSQESEKRAKERSAQYGDEVIKAARDCGKLIEINERIKAKRPKKDCPKEKPEAEDCSGCGLAEVCESREARHPDSRAAH